MHMGNARGGVLGDALASILQRAGYNVWREFYVNDAGNQIEKFASSIQARYIQLIRGEDAVEFPRGRLPRGRHKRTCPEVLRQIRRQLSG
jgi:arginyl-tRNA synthetase